MLAFALALALSSASLGVSAQDQCFNCTNPTWNGTEWMCMHGYSCCYVDPCDTTTTNGTYRFLIPHVQPHDCRDFAATSTNVMNNIVIENKDPNMWMTDKFCVRFNDLPDAYMHMYDCNIHTYEYETNGFQCCEAYDCWTGDGYTFPAHSIPNNCTDWYWNMPASTRFEHRSSYSNLYCIDPSTILPSTCNESNSYHYNMSLDINHMSYDCCIFDCWAGGDPDWVAVNPCRDWFDSHSTMDGHSFKQASSPTSLHYCISKAWLAGDLMNLCKPCHYVQDNGNEACCVVDYCTLPDGTTINPDDPHLPMNNECKMWLTTNGVSDPNKVRIDDWGSQMIYCVDKGNLSSYIDEMHACQTTHSYGFEYVNGARYHCCYATFCYVGYHLMDPHGSPNNYCESMAYDFTERGDWGDTVSYNERRKYCTKAMSI